MCCVRTLQISSAFVDRYRDHTLPMNLWLRTQASFATAADVAGLKSSPFFDSSNPNKVYALFGGFFFANPNHFHDSTGAGYQLLTDSVLALDAVNPQVGARGCYHRGGGDTMQSARGRKKTPGT